jgi:hypothetical protein
MTSPDNTIRPNYYQASIPANKVKRFVDESGNDAVGVECFDLIDALGFDFYLGNVLKYLWRAGKKDGASKVDDLRKVKTYIEQAIERAGGENK